MKNNIAISINVTAHNEGLLLYKTLRSVEAMCADFSSKNGEKYEVNITLDNADRETSRVADEFKSDYFKPQVYNVSFGDIALCRNYLVQKSIGKYCTFIDGDDLFSGNYLHEAYKTAISKGQMNIYSPEYLVSFANHNYVVKKLDFNSKDFHIINCFEVNYFISQSFASRKIFEEILFRSNSDGYSMEDWDWNNSAIAKGYGFYNVPNTIFFCRRKKHSMVTSQSSIKVALRPNELYSPRVFSSYPTYDFQIGNRQIKHDDVLKNKTKKIIKFSTFGSESFSTYLKDQYITNKRFFGNLKAKKIEAQESSMDSLKMHDICLMEWKAINGIEPLIRASSEVLKSFEVGKYETLSKSSLLYHKLCEKNVSLGGNYKHLVVVPHLVKGGADLAAIKLITALSEIDTDSRIIVISTMNVLSPWASKLDELTNVDYFSPHQYFNDIPKDEIELVLLRMLQHWGITNFHIVNSEVAYSLLIDYEAVIGDTIKVFLHTYAFDMDNEGYIYNYIANGLVDTYPRVDLFITDSQMYKKQLCLVNGFDERKITTLALPVDDSLEFTEHSKRRMKKLLWAGRVSDAKLVEVAVAVGEMLQRHGIELHFYGHLDYEYSQNDAFKTMIAGIDTIYYHGPFDKFSDIPINEYDALLFTSKNEGLPNILLESVSTNMFVIAADVGAVSEVVIDGENGLLISTAFVPDAYVNAILKFYRMDIQKQQQLTTRTNKILLSKRDFNSYKDAILDILYL